MRVLIVDDHDAVRAGVLKLFEQEPQLHAAGVAGGHEAVLASRRDAFDVAVVDYQLGHGEDGLTVTRDLRRPADPPRVLLYAEVGRALGLTPDELEARREKILDVLAAPPGLALVGS